MHRLADHARQTAGMGTVGIGFGTCVVAALLGLVSGCVGMSSDDAKSNSAPDNAVDVPPSTEVRPGVDAWVIEPGSGSSEAGAVIVLVPGGGWVAADPGGLVPLAKALSDDGATVVGITYRTSSDGAYFPEPVEDVACGVAYAVREAQDRGLLTEQVVVVGHSAGAQLGALVALADDGFAARGCPYEPVLANRLVGLAGPYDVTALPGAASNLFGPEYPNPDDWGPGDPFTLVADRPEVEVLLVHGAADTLVAPAFSEQFARALESAGHDVTAEYPAGVDHQSVYSAQVAAGPIGSWLGLDQR